MSGVEPDSVALAARIIPLEGFKRDELSVARLGGKTDRSVSVARS